MRGRIAALVMLCVVAVPVWATASNLSATASDMALGSFVELTGMTNFGGGAILNPSGCTGGDVITQYANRASWNPIARRFQFSGAPHAPCSGGTNERAVFYDDATNSWGDLPLPPSSANDPWHAHDHNEVDQTTGNHYYINRAYQLVRLNNGASSWTSFPFKPGNHQCCVSISWFPDFSGGPRLIYVDGDWGVWSWNPATATWTQHSQGNGSDGSGLPQFLGLPYQTFSRYSARCHCVIFGGGENFHKLNSNGSFTALTMSGGPSQSDMRIGPLNGSSNGSSFVVEPVSGVMIVLTAGVLRVFDPGTTNSSAGSWATPGTSIPSFFNAGAGGMSESLISAPVSTYGVVMYVKCDDASACRVYLYKHAPFTPGPTPGVPGGLAVR